MGEMTQKCKNISAGVSPQCLSTSLTKQPADVSITSIFQFRRFFSSLFSNIRSAERFLDQSSNEVT